MELTFENIAKVYTAFAKDGRAVNATVEVGIANGIGIHLVGLANEAVKECLLRVIAALQTCGYSFPGKKIVVNIAPALPTLKNVGFMDLPIAIGVLLASKQIEVDSNLLEGCLFYGELGLDGSVRPADNNGIYAAMATAGLLARHHSLLTVKQNAVEAALLPSIYPYGFDTLGQVVEVLTRKQSGRPFLACNLKEWKEIVDRQESMKGFVNLSL